MESLGTPLPDPANLAFVEALYQRWQSSPSEVPPAWRPYFETMAQEDNDDGTVALGPTFTPPGLFCAGATGRNRAARHAVLQDRADQLIRSYRVRGHMHAKLDPLDRPRPIQEELDPAFHGFTEADLDRVFSADTIPGKKLRPLREILEHLQQTYCRSIGVQYFHIDDVKVRGWLRDEMESTRNRLDLSRDDQIRILERLLDAVIFESFIRKKFVGAKSFSLEGGETLIPLLDLAIENAGAMGVEQVVLAMAHRGRLNTLANIMGKSPRQIFVEFVDPEMKGDFAGDVKYHLGFSSDWTTREGKNVRLALCFNPSHLEFVGPVAMGRTRAKQDRAGDTTHERALCVVVHGDAAFIGEGVVQEALNMSQVPAYTTGGTLHIVLNNQIGFTTSPDEGRSSQYATDVARMLQIPIFHVNGEDPEAVAQVVSLALRFQRKFHRDVVIDLYCYRRRGHNETDEASFTQPVMARLIAERSSVLESYRTHMINLGKISEAEAKAIEEARHAKLDAELAVVREGQVERRFPSLERPWDGFFGGSHQDADYPVTATSKEHVVHVIKTVVSPPEGFEVNHRLKRVFQQRAEMAEGTRPLDWGTAELAAFGTIAMDGHRVRMSGQDSCRGTFSQRHAVLYDELTGEAWHPLRSLSEDQAAAEIYNSTLSEAAVMGFEYGYADDCPEGLIVWEAQFGDFVNAAQVIIDQFLVSAEDKWARLNGLVLLLPHGFEGQGPEHSSARLERFLDLTAEHNIQVAQPTTPAQHFHLLRRQALRKWRKPLVVMTPKGLLRHAEATSSLDELTSGEFRHVLPDPELPEVTQKVIFCTGRIFYDLIARRRELKNNDTAILRIEQLYPIPGSALRAALEPFKEGTPIVWVQEEPENMGAWRYLAHRLGPRISDRHPISGVYRNESASPATGSHKTHQAEQERILDQAFAPVK